MSSCYAGSQFSFPLIDLQHLTDGKKAGWESVLFSPDRLDLGFDASRVWLGVSSLFP